MKLLISLILAAGALCAQYATIAGSDYPANSRGQLNLKPASRVAAGAPTGACTAGLDYYINSATSLLYGCPAGSWVAVAAGSTTGNAATATALATPRAINGTNFDGTAAVTVSAAAGTLTGTTLASNVVTSSLTTVGTIASGTWQGGVISAAYGGAGTISGVLKANGSGTVSAAAAGTDYLSPSALTTTGAIPYVTSAGVLGQDATKLFWDSANQRLGVGTASPGSKLEIQNTVNVKAVQIVNSSAATGVAGLNIYSNNVHTGVTGNSMFAVEVANAGTTGTAFYVQQAGTGLNAAFNGGNVAIGNTPTNGNYKLDIQSSGSTGTLRVYDQGGAGSTLAVIQAGAAQSTNPLALFKNNAGTTLITVSSDGAIYGPGSVYYMTAAGYFAGAQWGDNNSQAAINSSGVTVYQSGLYKFTNGISFSSTVDLALARNAAGVLEINNGTAGTLRDLYLRRERFEAVAVTNLPAAASWPGTVQYVTDANATTIGSVVAAGGSNKVLVWSNGTDWKIYAN